MTTQDFIMALFYAVDQERLEVPKHPEAKLYPSEVITLALLFAIKGGGMRAFYRWLTRDYLLLLPQVPERTRLARLCKTPNTVDGPLSGGAHGVGGRRQLWDRVDPSHAGRPQPGPDREERAKQSSVDCGRQTLFHLESMGLDLRLGLRHSERPRHAFSSPDCAV
jgi:hypothetical protein